MEDWGTVGTTLVAHRGRFSGCAVALHGPQLSNRRTPTNFYSDCPGG